MWVYALIAFIMIVIAFVVAKVVGVPDVAAKVGLEEEIEKAKVSAGAATESNEKLQEVVYEEVGQFVNSKYKRQELARVISNFVDKELRERLDRHTEELRKQYEQELSAKAKNEEIALKKYNKVLIEKKNTEAVIRSIAEGLVVVDAQGKVIMMNPAAEKMLDTDKKEKIGKSILQDLKDGQLISLAKPSSEEGEREIELNTSRDETRRILRSSSAVIENENGETVGMVSVLSDITKQKELDRLKESFIANVTHELRTPLIAIDKSVKLLLSGEPGALAPAQKQFLDIAERNLKRLSNLINDLLDISKLESGKMTLNCKPSSIEKIISDVAQSFESWAGTKAITIVKQIQKDLPLVSVDVDRIIQVFNNLIGNAIKFTPQGGTITLSAKKEDNAVQLGVVDTGIGIAKEDLNKIFDKFYQSGQRAANEISGTGLGLSIAKEIVDLHKGSIRVESELGKGTKFIITLPLEGG